MRKKCDVTMGLYGAGLTVMFASLLPVLALAEAKNFVPEQTAKGLCKAGEVVLFDCEIRSKRVSICASADYDATKGHLVYRFGRVDAIELEMPKNRTGGPATEVRLDIYPNGSSFGYFRFYNGPTAYVVYHANYRDDMVGWREKAGLAVVQGRKKTRYLVCTGTIISRLLDDRIMNQRLGFMQNDEVEPFVIP